ncbi:MAG: DUF2855 family protein [Nocardioides sp.]
MSQFQVSRTDLTRTRLVEDLSIADEQMLPDGEALVRVDRFGLSANNVTYAVLGERLGYWRFFPALDDAAGQWGVMPVWGFGDVIASRADNLREGERLFGYFPPATHLRLRPEGRPGQPVRDGTPHRAELPGSYNSYLRVLEEAGYDPADDDLRMLLFPLHITAWALWEQLRGEEWYGAEQVVIVSASSKTALGVAHALRLDDTSPRVVGITSPGNRAFVEGLGLYDDVLEYDAVEAALAHRPSVVVDMSGNRAVLGGLHRHLGEDMRRSLNVGLTHWEESGGGGSDLIRERSEMFFAPSVITARHQEWGAHEYGRRTSAFLSGALEAGRDWLRVERSEGLETLDALYSAVRDGSAAPEAGFVIAP